MLHQIVSLALAALSAALTAFPVDMAHNHCDDVKNPLCTPKGVVPHDDGGLSGAVEDVLLSIRGSGRDREPGTQQG